MGYVIKEAVLVYDSQSEMFKCRVLPELMDDVFTPKLLPSYPFLNKVISLSEGMRVLVLVEEDSNFQQGYILEEIAPKEIGKKGILVNDEDVFPEPELPSGVSPKVELSFQNKPTDSQVVFLLKEGSPPYIFKSEDYTIFALTETMLFISAKDGKSYLKLNDSIVLVSEGSKDRFYIGKGNSVTDIIFDLNIAERKVQIGAKDDIQPHISLEKLLEVLDLLVEDIKSIHSSAVGEVVGQAQGLKLNLISPILGVLTQYQPLLSQIKRRDVSL